MVYFSLRKGGTFLAGKVDRPAVSDSSPAYPTISWQPVAGFAWLTLVLFDIGRVQSRQWMLFSGCLALSACILRFGGWRSLAQRISFLPALALFFTGEAFVWGTYGKYMHPAFRVGVYVFHVAGASFVHYAGSYAYGNSRNVSDRWLRPLWILSVNIAAVALCYTAAWLPGLGWLSPLLGLEWFTFWVAAHLASSDLLPAWKRTVLRHTARG